MISFMYLVRSRKMRVGYLPCVVKNVVRALTISFSSSRTSRASSILDDIVWLVFVACHFELHRRVRVAPHRQHDRVPCVDCSELDRIRQPERLHHVDAAFVGPVDGQRYYAFGSEFWSDSERCVAGTMLIDFHCFSVNGAASSNQYFN